MKRFPVTLRAKAPAKINLSLDLLGKRDDGYHDLRSVMASISLYDDLHIMLRPCKAGRGLFTAQAAGVRKGNLTSLAVKLFMQAAGARGWSAHVRVEKRIPLSAGLGGGSSDAAAVLRALDKWAAVQTAVRRPDLQELALKLGSDVPYCLRGGVCLAEGRGERLTPLPPLPECWIVLSVPAINVSTVRMFQLFDLSGRREGDNVFETVNPHPEVGEIKQVLLQAGASKALMSGSGPSVFGIFDDETQAADAVQTLKPIFPKTFLTVPV